MQAIINKLNVYDSLCERNRVWHSWPTASRLQLTEIIPVWIPGWNGETRNTGLTRVVGVLRAPLFEAFYSGRHAYTSLYISILVSSSSWPTSFSLLLSSHSPSHSRDFSRRLKFMLTRVPACAHIAFRLAQCSFCAGLRTRFEARVYTRTHRYVFRDMIPVFLSRFSHLALSLTSLFVSAGRDRAAFRHRTENLQKRKRATKGPPMTGFLSAEVKLQWSRCGKLGLLFIKIRMAFKKK